MQEAVMLFKQKANPIEDVTKMKSTVESCRLLTGPPRV